MNCISFPKLFKGNQTLIKKDIDATSECMHLLLSSEVNEMFGNPDFGIRLKKFTFDQNNYILRDIGKILELGEKLDREKLFTYLKKYRSDYLGRKLSYENYRELDSEMFRVGSHLLTEISDDMISFIDISQNYINYILKIFNCIL